MLLSFPVAEMASAATLLEPIPEGLWGRCDMHAAPKPRTPPVSAAQRKEAPTYLSADYGFAVKDKLAVFSGDALVRRADERLAADTVIYDEAKGTAQAQGNVHYRSDNLEADGDAGYMELETDKGQFDNAQYRFEEQHARGEAVMIIKENAEVTRLRQSTYTTCNPGSETWLLRSSTLRLDEGKGIGEVYNATVRFMGVPFFYMPYMSFPINSERKSGFLIPRFLPSTSSGMDIRIPYYLNLAPDYDATITARYMTLRGVLMDGEFRYLNRTSRGGLTLGYLPNDTLYGKERTAFTYRHSGSPAEGWSTDLNLNYVSDIDYFRNFGNSLSAAAVVYAERRFDVAYQSENLTFLGRVQGMQPLDRTLPSAARPYRVLPRLQLTAGWPGQEGAPGYRFQGEVVRFEQEDRLNGARLDLQPEISFPWQRDAGFVTPKLILRHTRYLLENVLPGVPESPSRTLPIFNIDSGLFLERDFAWGARPLLQTLEPRLFYLYTPYHDQSALPVFDSGVPDFNFAQLFRDNRFNGVDRVGDANQLSASLTTRLLDSGAELIRASIGQIYYLEDRQVTFPGGVVDARHTSDIVGEVAAKVAQSWTASGDLFWNPNVERVERGSVRIQYQPLRNHILNLSYRYRRDQMDQMDLSLFWPLHRNWSVIGRWYYSIPDSRILESLAGLEYNSCCWAFTILTRDYTTGVTATGANTSNRSLMFQLELKGLMSVGQSISTMLERGILGYQGAR